MTHLLPISHFSVHAKNQMGNFKHFPTSLCFGLGVYCHGDKSENSLEFNSPQTLPCLKRCFNIHSGLLFLKATVREMDETFS